MGEWLPIDSAPMDGTVVIIFDGGDGDPFFDIAGFSRGEWRDMTGRPSCNPSHWMALPRPPANG